MISLIIAVFIVLFVFIVARLRGLLEFSAPRHITYWEKEREDISPLLEEMFAERELALVSMGFKLLCPAQVELEPAIESVASECRFYINFDRRTVAKVQIIYRLDHSQSAQIDFYSRWADGDELLKTCRASNDSFLERRRHIQIINSDDTRRLYESHQRFIEDMDTVPWPEDNRQILRLIGEFQENLILENLKKGLLTHKQNGALGLTVKGAYSTFFSKKLRPVHYDNVPTARLALFHLIQEKQRRLYFYLPQYQEWLFFITCVAGIMLLSTYFLHLSYALPLLLVIFIHEGSHWLTMRLLGYRKINVVFLPLVGGLTISREENPSSAAQAWTALMAPLLGLSLGIGLFLGAAWAPDTTKFIHSLGMDSKFFYNFLRLLLIVNVLNLIPMLPLDGGQLLRHLFPRQSLGLAMLFCLVSLGLLFWYIRTYGAYALAIFSVGLVIMMGRLWMQSVCLARWREEPRGNAMRDFHQALNVVRETYPRMGGNVLSQAQLAEDMVRTVRKSRMNWFSRIFFLFVWLSAVPVTYWIIYKMPL